MDFPNYVESEKTMLGNCLFIFSIKIDITLSHMIIYGQIGHFFLQEGLDNLNLTIKFNSTKASTWLPLTTYGIRFLMQQMHIMLKYWKDTFKTCKASMQL